MADVYEVVLAATLHDPTDAELAELRWHVGDAPIPAEFPIGTNDFVAAYPLGDPADPDCEWETDAPEPLFAERGAGRHIGGELTAALARTANGWTLTARQELHPDSFYTLRRLLTWLDAPTGHLRFHEDHEDAGDAATTPLSADSEAITAHTPDWPD